jgi:DNA-binding MarR family transcriptional regulator
MKTPASFRTKDLDAATEIRRSITRMARLLGAGMPRGELTPIRLTALVILQGDGPITANALAVRLGVLPQSLTRILKDLEDAGLLKRERDPSDMREYVLKATPKARSLMREEGIRRDRLLREAMQRLLASKEIHELGNAAATLNKLADGWNGAKAKTAESK